MNTRVRLGRESKVSEKVSFRLSGHTTIHRFIGFPDLSSNKDVRKKFRERVGSPSPTELHLLRR